MTKSELRQEAYKFVIEKLNKPSTPVSDPDVHSPLPLDELLLLKEGKSDPSPALVTLLRELLKGKATDAEIDAYLINPFKSQ